MNKILAEAIYTDLVTQDWRDTVHAVMSGEVRASDSVRARDGALESMAIVALKAAEAFEVQFTAAFDARYGAPK